MIPIPIVSKFLTSKVGIIAIAVMLLLVALFFLRQSWQESAVLKQSVKDRDTVITKLKTDHSDQLKVLAERSKQLRTAELKLRSLHSRVDTLEATNEEFRRWSKQPLPAPVVDIMCRITKCPSRTNPPATGAALGVSPTVVQ